MYAEALFSLQGWSGPIEELLHGDGRGWLVLCGNRKRLRTDGRFGQMALPSCEKEFAETQNRSCLVGFLWVALASVAKKAIPWFRS
jgi:hypothetical protein